MKRKFKSILDSSIIWIAKGVIIGIGLMVTVKYMIWHEQPSNYYIFLLMLNLAIVIIDEIRDNKADTTVTIEKIELFNAEKNNESKI